ncbi:GNAT family N-acetyltransferase [Cryobacterium sp. BB307]|uniref:GNAT family N-acetyltransferase n=1 Tax=Cryobacterium sp. BB307 TaxID=2716317 RepID=UPI001444DEB8|nr:GNAT family N-acetyltransferase [Cryobacterium sp. BB307]
MSFTIRPARAEDADRMGVVIVQSWHETYAHLLPAETLASLDPAERADMWRRAIERRGGVGGPVVAEVDGVVVGLAGAGTPLDEDPPVPLQLYVIYLLAAHHGSGAGQGLLDAAIGTEPALVWVAEDNPRAIAFYERNGFVRDGTSDELSIGDGSIHEIRMVRGATA